MILFKSHIEILMGIQQKIFHVGKIFYKLAVGVISQLQDQPDSRRMTQ
jgi:hypothetical protein